MSNHGQLTVAADIHRAHAFEYADAVARTGATGLTINDVGKWAVQLDDNTIWILTDESPVTWEQLVGGGGGAVDSVNGATGVVVLDADDIDDTSTTNKFADATSVAAAGAVMEADTTTAAMGFVIDEDSMASDLATKVPTQQSVKAYVDAAVLASGSYTDEQAQDAIGGILTDSSSIDFSYDDVANTITAVVIQAWLEAEIDARIAEGGGDSSAAVPWMFTHRVGYTQAQPNSVTMLTVGMPGFTPAGTTAIADDADGNFVSHSIAVINNKAGMQSNATQYQPDWGMTYQARIKTGADITSVRHWFGMSSSNLIITTDTPTAHMAAFRRSTSVPDTNWKCVTSDNTGTLTITDSGVACAASTPYSLRIVFGIATAKFYIDDVLVATHETSGGDKMPATGAQLGWYANITTLVGSARVINIGQVLIATLN